MPIRVKEQNEEVLFSLDAATLVDKHDIEGLKTKAERNRGKKVRLCAHQDVGDPVHEMLIVQHKEAYGRPHKHLNKSESLHVIEGSADLVGFDEEGNITSVTPMGDVSSGRNFYHRIANESYHALVFHSDVLIFHESKTGPWTNSDPVWAPWAPKPDEAVAVTKYMEDLRRAVIGFAATASERSQHREL